MKRLKQKYSRAGDDVRKAREELAAAEAACRDLALKAVHAREECCWLGLGAADQKK